MTENRTVGWAQRTDEYGDTLAAVLRLVGQGDADES